MSRALRRRYGHAGSTARYFYEEMTGAHEGLTETRKTLQGAIDYGNARFGFKGGSPLGVRATAARVTPYRLAVGPSNYRVEAEWRDPDGRLIGVVWR